MLKRTRISAAAAILLVVCIIAAACGKSEINIEDTSASTDYSDVSELSVSPAETFSDVSDTSSAAAVVAGTEGINITTTKNDSSTKSGTAAQTTAEAVITTKAAASPTTSVQTTEDVDISSMSLKEIQDLLFVTDDPNTAGEILEIAGFEYDADQGIYYSSMYPIQRNFGFNVLYDLAAPRSGMIYDTKRILFTYNDKDWMIQLWKGQYGITVGAEIGIYNKPTSRFLPQYDCVSDDELVEMSMTLYKDGEVYFTRGPEKHWWLTGFKIMDITVLVDLRMDFTMTFEDTGMANAVHRALRDQIIESVTYERVDNTFYMSW